MKNRAKISGAQAMVQCLQAEGVTLIFGYPGATIAPFYDSLPESNIRHILTRGEQSAGHAASGYARISGRPGVCITTSGPGATNLFTALATAFSDSIPLVAITGQVPTTMLGHDVFQEVDTTGAVTSFAKYSFLVKKAEDLPQIFKEAFYIATAGRPGPVLIDVPVDVQRQMLSFQYPDKVSIRGYKPNYEGHPKQIKKVVEAINRAERPLICCGGGAQAETTKELIMRFCEKTGIPTVSTMMGISVLPPEHNLYFGMLGQSGLQTANQAVKESDLLVLIGARVGDRTISQPGEVESSTTVVHIDIDTAEIGKNLGARIPLVGDAGLIVQELLRYDIKGQWGQWMEHLSQLRAAEQKRVASLLPNAGEVEPNALISQLCRQLPKDVVYVADVGQNQIYSARNFCADGRFMTTGGMGTMGYSLPAALGAKLAAPKRLVIAVCGDGAFQMCMNEMATMRQHDVPIKIVLMRNNKLGLVSEIQQYNFGGREIAVDLSGSPDYGILARAYGIKHQCVASLGEAKEGIQRMLEDEQAFILECVVQ